MADDPLDLARGALTKLKDADDWDEPTGRTEVHVHVPQPSQPDVETTGQFEVSKEGAKLRGIPPWMLGVGFIILSLTAAVVVIAKYWPR